MQQKERFFQHLSDAIKALIQLKHQWVDLGYNDNGVGGYDELTMHMVSLIDCLDSCVFMSADKLVSHLPIFFLINKLRSVSNLLCSTGLPQKEQAILTRVQAFCLRLYSSIKNRQLAPGVILDQLLDVHKKEEFFEAFCRCYNAKLFPWDLSAEEKFQSSEHVFQALYLTRKSQDQVAFLIWVPLGRRRWTVMKELSMYSQFNEYSSLKFADTVSQFQQAVKEFFKNYNARFTIASIEGAGGRSDSLASL